MRAEAVARRLSAVSGNDEKRSGKSRRKGSEPTELAPLKPDEAGDDWESTRETMPTIPDSCPTIQTVEPIGTDTIPAPAVRDTTIDDLGRKPKSRKEKG